MKKLLSIFIAGFFFTQIARAQTNTQSAVSDSVTVSEITVSAFRYGQKLLNTPGAISIISKDQIQKDSELPINQLVNKTAGVFMQSGTLNTNRLTIRGIGSRSPYSTNKIRAYFEGIPLTNGVGETSIEDLNLQTFSKIEIIKGPASGFYGSGLGGTILFGARQAQNDLAEASFTIGSYNTYRQRVSVLLNRDDFKHGLYFENLSSDGYRENNKTERSNLTYVGQLNTERHQFNLFIHNTGLKAFIPSSIDLSTYESTPAKAAEKWAETGGFEDYQKLLAGFSVPTNWKETLNSQISIFVNQYNNYELRPFNILNEESNYWGGRFILEKTFKTNLSQWKLSVGNESFFERYDWQTFENEERQKGLILSNNHENRNYINNFIQLSLKANKKLIASLSTNLNTTRYKYTDRYLDDDDQSGSHRFKTIFSPRLALSYPLTKMQRVFATISHGFSPPSLEETLLPNGERNKDIQPETGWSYELGSRGTLFPGLYFEASAYYMNIHNLLVASRIAEDAYIGINAGQTAHPGFEYSIDLKLIKTNKLSADISHNGNFSPYYFVDFIDNEQDFSGNKLTGSPRFSSFSAVSFIWKKDSSLRLNHHLIGSMPLNDENTVSSKQSSVFNLTGSFKKEYKKIHFEFCAGIYHLLNEKYASMFAINASSFGGNDPRYYYPGMPLNYSLSFKMSYKL